MARANGDATVSAGESNRETRSRGGEDIDCPHCGESNGDLWDHDWSGSSETVETECGECEKPFTLTRSISVSYTAVASQVCAICHGSGKGGHVYPSAQSARRDCAACRGTGRVAA